MLLVLESGGNVEWLGDGFCDDKNNNVFCHFDKADCCGNGVNKQFCIDCDCISKPKNFYCINEMHFTTFLIGFLDELHVKTKCGSDAGSSDKLIVTLCQDARCCTTGSVQMENGADDCSITDIFEDESLLGTCTDSYFKLDSVYGSLTYSDHTAFDTDNWRGEWMTIIFTDGNYLDCQIEDWIGSNNLLDFSCSPGGIIFTKWIFFSFVKLN